METRNQKKGGDGPKLLHAGILFGAALVVSLGVGILIQSDSAEPERTARAERPAPPRVERPRPVPARTPVAVVASQPASVEPAVSVAASSHEENCDGFEMPTFRTAETLYFEGNFEQAATQYERILQDDPENAWGHYMLGLSRRRAGDLEGSEAAFVRALEIAPDHGKSLVNLSRTLLSAERAGDALPYIATAVVNHAESVDAHRVHGRVLHTLGRREEALDAYAAALELDPLDAWSLNNSGLILIESERFDEAAGRLALAVEADSSVATFHNNHGIALERLGRYREAESAFAQAMDLGDSSGKARVSLARVAELDDVVVPIDPVPASAELAGAEPVEENAAELLVTSASDDSGPGSADETRPE